MDSLAWSLFDTLVLLLLFIIIGQVIMFFRIRAVEKQRTEDILHAVGQLEEQTEKRFAEIKQQIANLQLTIRNHNWTSGIVCMILGAVLGALISISLNRLIPSYSGSASVQVDESKDKPAKVGVTLDPDDAGPEKPDPSRFGIQSGAGHVNDNEDKPAKTDVEPGASHVNNSVTTLLKAEFKIVKRELGIESYDDPFVRITVKNVGDAAGHNVFCKVRAKKNGIVIDEATAYCAGGRHIDPGGIAHGRAIFFKLDSHDEYDTLEYGDLEWLDRW